MPSSDVQRAAPTHERSDVFAEYSRLERQTKGYAKDESKGYGIWVAKLAKVVASRKFASRSDSPKTPGPSKKRAGTKTSSIGWARPSMPRCSGPPESNTSTPSISRGIRLGRAYACAMNREPGSPAPVRG